MPRAMIRDSIELANRAERLILRRSVQFVNRTGAEFLLGAATSIVEQLIFAAEPAGTAVHSLLVVGDTVFDAAVSPGGDLPFE